MQKIFSSLIILVLCFALAQNSFAAPLVFKTVKEIRNADRKDYVELANFDSSNFKQIRIGIERNSAASEASFQIEAVESENTIKIADLFLNDTISGSVVIETPPTRVRISVKESGTYKIFVWAS